jgi:hypothetical protein
MSMKPGMLARIDEDYNPGAEADVILIDPAGPSAGSGKRRRTSETAPDYTDHDPEEVFLAEQVGFVRGGGEERKGDTVKTYMVSLPFADISLKVAATPGGLAQLEKLGGFVVSPPTESADMDSSTFVDMYSDEVKLPTGCSLCGGTRAKLLAIPKKGLERSERSELIHLMRGPPGKPAPRGTVIWVVKYKKSFTGVSDVLCCRIEIV